MHKFKRIFLMLLIVSLLNIEVALMLSSCGNLESEDLAFECVIDESYFIDYEITTENKIKIRYSICFINHTEDDLVVQSLSFTFKKKDISGWLKYEDSFDCLEEHGNILGTRINAFEKVNVTFVFEGEYLGGKVNETLSFKQCVFCLGRADQVFDESND